MDTETATARRVSEVLREEGDLVWSSRDYATGIVRRRQHRRVVSRIAIGILVLAIVVLGGSLAVVGHRGVIRTPTASTSGHPGARVSSALGGPTLDVAGFSVKSSTGSIPSLALCAPVPIAGHHYLPVVIGGAVAEKNPDGGCIEAVMTTGDAPGLSGAPQVDPLLLPGVLSGATAIRVGPYPATVGTVPSDGTEVLVVRYPDPSDPAYHYDLVVTATGMTVQELEAAVQTHPPQLGHGEPPPPCGSGGCG